MTITGSKYCIPRIPNTVLSRPRLLTQLDKGLKSKLTIITAPSGYGKTTIMSEWLMEKTMSVAWITLEKEDNRWIRFWSHLILAIQKESPQFENEDVEAYLRHENELIVRLIGHLNGLNKPIIIVLDDFHFIENEMILKDLSYLIKQIPIDVHFYLITRVQPALRLSKLDINGDINEFKKEDFLFNEEELGKLDDEYLALQLTKQEEETIITRTEGWITGIKLAVLIMQKSNQVSNQLGELSGRHPKIIAYFMEEVFELQPVKIQQFLMQTAILTNMTSELCKVTTGLEESSQLLQEIEDNNLFLTLVDDTKGSYRYHQLFREFLMVQLKEQVPKEMIKKLHMKAGLWLESDGDYKEAIEHFMAAESYEQEMNLLEELLSEIIFDEEEKLWKQLEEIPNELLFTKPTMYLMNLASLFLDGKTAEAKDKYRWVQRRLQEGGLQPDEELKFQSGLLLWAACKCYLEKDYEKAIAYTKKYLKIDPDGNLLIEYVMKGKNYHPYLEDSEPSGALVAAERDLQSLVKIWSKTKNVYFYAQLCIDYGKLLYEWSSLEEVEVYAGQAIEIGKKHRNLHIEVEATLLLIKVQFAKEQDDQAEFLLGRLRNLIKQEKNVELIRKVKVFKMKRDWYFGRKESAKKWASEIGFDIEGEITGEKLDQYIFWSVILIETGGYEQAKKLLGRLLWQSQNEGNQRRVIRVLLCQSILLEREGQEIQSFFTFEEALLLATRDKYLRTFIDIGKPMISLFEKYLGARKTQSFGKTNEIPIDYVKDVFSHFPLENRLELSIESASADSILTERELEVLACMESGLSGKGIASKLNIAMSTMKTHTNNIYRKLKVNSRLQAVQRARRLRIIESDEMNKEE